MNAEYLALVITPSINFTNPDDEALSNMEIDAYFRQLELSRLEFIASLSTCRESVALAYINELRNARKVYQSYWKADNKSETAVRHKLVHLFPIPIRWHRLTMNGIMSRYIMSIDKTIEFLLTLAPADTLQHTNETLEDSQPVQQPDPLPEHPISEAETKTAAIISGTDGLAKALGCSNSMAFSIIKSGVLKESGIQYKVGRSWKFNRVKLEEYLSAKPDILSKVRCKH